MGYLTIRLLHHTAQEVGIRCITRIRLLDPEERRETLGRTLFDLDGSLRWWGRGRQCTHCTPQQGNHEETAEKLHPYRHSCSPSKCILHTYHMYTVAHVQGVWARSAFLCAVSHSIPGVVATERLTDIR